MQILFQKKKVYTKIIFKRFTHTKAHKDELTRCFRTLKILYGIIISFNNIRENMLKNM